MLEMENQIYIYLQFVQIHMQSNLVKPFPREFPETEIANQVCAEDGPPLSVDKQLCWPLQSCSFYR